MNIQGLNTELYTCFVKVTDAALRLTETLKGQPGRTMQGTLEESFGEYLATFVTKTHWSPQLNSSFEQFSMRMKRTTS